MTIFYATKARIGDICEIQTPVGRAYIQYTHDGGGMGELVRVLPGLFESRPSDFSELTRQRELYFIFYTLAYALRDKQAEIVSHQPVPDWAKEYPLMRWCGARDAGGKPITWKIFKASTPLTVEEHLRIPIIYDLTPEQRKLSVHELWPHPVMVKELSRGWTPERAEELRRQDFELPKTSTASITQQRVTPMKHYLYFPTKASAEAAGTRLRSEGVSVEIRKGAGGENWLALAAKAPPQIAEEMEGIRDQMEALAAQFGGEYDGWETAIDSLGPDASDRIN